MKLRNCLAGWIVAFLGLGVAAAQEPVLRPPGAEDDRLPPPLPQSNNSVPSRNGFGPGPANNAANNRPNGYSGAPGNGSAPEDLSGPPPIGPGLSSWLSYPRCGCCGPVGGHGPVMNEVYVRGGVSMPFGGGLAGHLSPGPWVQFGGRTLLFDPQALDAWTIDLGLSTTWYGPDQQEFVTFRNIIATQPSIFGGAPTVVALPTYQAKPSVLNQTLLNLSLGRECYLLGSGACTSGCTGPTWRAGWDIGGRYGTARLSFSEREALPANQTTFRHLTDVVGGFFFAVHSDLEIPTGCCILFAGIRAEYGVVFSDILQPQNNADVQSINLLLNFGLRF